VTATVAASTGTILPAGSVVFTIGSATQTVALNASGVATWTGTAPTAVGPLSITAAYQGSTEFAQSASSTLSETVAAIPTTTVLTISPSQASLQIATGYTLTATVTPSTGTTTPTGSVIFTIGSANQTVALNSTGAAIYTGTAPVTTGPLSISAAYQGSSEFAQSTSNSLTETIANPVPVISILSPANATAGGAAFTLTINGSSFINGSTIYSGSTALTTQYVSSTQLKAQVLAANIASAGVLDVSVQSPAPGGGTSNTLQFEVDTPGATNPPSFTTAVASISAGSTASYSVTLSSSATNVSVTCLNLPTGATCAYSASSGTVTITTSSSTPKGTYQVTVVFTETQPGAATSLVVLPFLLLPLLFIRKKVAGRGIWLTACLCLVALSFAFSAVGCGGGGGTGSLTTPTNPTHEVNSSGTVSLTIQ
jgi:hypothetical protein